MFAWCKLSGSPRVFLASFGWERVTDDWARYPFLGSPGNLLNRHVAIFQNQTLKNSQAALSHHSSSFCFFDITDSFLYHFENLGLECKHGGCEHKTAFQEPVSGKSRKAVLLAVFISKVEALIVLKVTQHSY